MNIAIVVSEFNDNVTSRMHKVALEKARELKLNVKYECKVPGVFDMPLVIDTLLQKMTLMQLLHWVPLSRGKQNMMN